MYNSPSQQSEHYPNDHLSLEDLIHKWQFYRGDYKEVEVISYDTYNAADTNEDTYEFSFMDQSMSNERKNESSIQNDNMEQMRYGL